MLEILVRVCAFCYLEQGAGILITQVNVDHLEQRLHLIIAHLIIVVLVGPTQVSMNPGNTKPRSRKKQEAQGNIYDAVGVAIGALNHRSNV